MSDSRAVELSSRRTIDTHPYSGSSSWWNTLINVWNQPFHMRCIPYLLVQYTLQQSWRSIGVSVTFPQRWPLSTDAPCHSRCGTLKNLMAVGVEQRSKFAAIHRQWWRLHMSEKLSSGTKNHKKNNNKQNIMWYGVLYGDIYVQWPV